MARTIQQVQQDLAELKQTVGQIAGEFCRLYLEYLTIFSKSVKKQLGQATYQICTQAYPESFLRLSFSQKEELQQNLLKIGKQLQEKLLQLENSPKSEKVPELQYQLQIILEVLPLVREMRKEFSKQEKKLETKKTDNLEKQQKFYENVEQEQKLLEQTQFSVVIDLSNPETLLNLQQELEKTINVTLEKISAEANRLLQQAKILPNKLPPNFLEVALQAEQSGSAISGPPNLLNFLVESEKDQSRENSTITQITVIRMGRGEMEFADSILESKRNEIRELTGKINTMRKKYQKKKRQLAIAEAEAAWRSSWYED